jgi:aminoglycoside phosphotransferase (APT) family kinase protein
MEATASDRIAWARMAADLGPDARVRRLLKLGGGLASDVFAVELDGAPFDRVVVKCFRPYDDTAAVEWECLEFAERISVPSPRRVALDLDGRWFGSPALVMTQLPGRADVNPGNVEDWLGQLSLAMATIHATGSDGATGALLRSPEVWERPTFRAGPLVERAIAAIDAHLPREGWPPVVVHGDFHPGQTLWQRGRLSGVVDWGDLLLGSRWYEVAYCRADVVFLFGVKAADRILDHYVDITGLEPVDLPAFDLLCGIHAREFGHRFLDAYREQGRTDSMRQCAARLTPFIRRALAELGG